MGMQSNAIVMVGRRRWPYLGIYPLLAAANGMQCAKYKEKSTHIHQIRPPLREVALRDERYRFRNLCTHCLVRCIGELDHRWDECLAQTRPVRLRNGWLILQRRVACVRSRKISIQASDTYVFPSRLDEVFEVDATGEADGAILGGLEDEGEEVGEEARLEAEGLQALLSLFPGVWAERGEEERGELGHGSRDAL